MSKQIKKPVLDPSRVVLEPECDKCGWHGSAPAVKGAVCPNKIEVKTPERGSLLVKCGAPVKGKTVSREAFEKAGLVAEAPGAEG